MRRQLRKRKGHVEQELPLAAMVDMMVNVLIFLLALYGSNISGLDAGAIELPVSIEKDPSTSEVGLVISSQGILVHGRPVVGIETTGEQWKLSTPPSSEGILPALAAALKPPPTEDGKLPVFQIACDRRVPWEILRAVTQTVQHAGYGQYRFVVLSGK